ncbi:MAG: glycosyltransferase, partial [Spirochaetota bacterium]
TNGYPINLTDIDSKTGVLWVSRLEPWKRPELCIEAAVKNPDIPFTMIAPVDEKNREYAEKIYKMAANINNITIHDFVGFRGIDVYFKEARVFLNTSTEEGFPNTFIQACKNMTPIVSLNVNPDDFLTRYGVGEYCANNVDKMNDAIVSVYTSDSLFEKYSVSAGEYVKNHHCIKVNAKKLEELFV